MSNDIRESVFKVVGASVLGQMLSLEDSPVTALRAMIGALLREDLRNVVTLTGMRMTDAEIERRVEEALDNYLHPAVVNLVALAAADVISRRDEEEVLVSPS